MFSCSLCLSLFFLRIGEKRPIYLYCGLGCLAILYDDVHDYTFHIANKSLPTSHIRFKKMNYDWKFFFFTLIWNIENRNEPPTNIRCTLSFSCLKTKSTHTEKYRNQNQRWDKLKKWYRSHIYTMMTINLWMGQPNHHHRMIDVMIVLLLVPQISFVHVFFSLNFLSVKQVGTQQSFVEHP